MAPKARRSTSKRTATAVTKSKKRAATRRPVIRVKFAGQNVPPAADEDAPPGQNKSAATAAEKPAEKSAESNDVAKAAEVGAGDEARVAADNNEVAAEEEAKVDDEKNEVAAEKNEAAAEKEATVAAEKNEVPAEKNEVAAEKNEVAAEKNEVAAEKNEAAAEKEAKVAAEKNEVAAENNTGSDVEIVEERKAPVKEGKEAEVNESKAGLDQWEAQVKAEATAKFNAIQEKKKTEKSYDYLLSQVVRFVGRRGDKPLRQETRTETAAWSHLDSSFSFRKFQNNAEFLAEAYAKKKGMANYALHSVRAEILESTAGGKKGNMNSNTSRIPLKMGVYNSRQWQEMEKMIRTYAAGKKSVPEVVLEAEYTEIDEDIEVYERDPFSSSSSEESSTETEKQAVKGPGRGKKKMEVRRPEDAAQGKKRVSATDKLLEQAAKRKKEEKDNYVPDIMVRWRCQGNYCENEGKACLRLPKEDFCRPLRAETLTYWNNEILLRGLLSAAVSL